MTCLVNLKRKSLEDAVIDITDVFSFVGDKTDFTITVILNNQTRFNITGFDGQTYSEALKNIENKINEHHKSNNEQILQNEMLKQYISKFDTMLELHNAKIQETITSATTSINTTLDTALSNGLSEFSKSFDYKLNNSYEHISKKHGLLAAKLQDATSSISVINDALREFKLFEE